MKVVITGGAGFIGSNLVRRFNDEAPEVEVHVLDDFSTGRDANLEGTKATLHRGSVADAEAVAAATVGADAIVHLGALGSVPRSIG